MTTQPQSSHLPDDARVQVLMSTLDRQAQRDRSVSYYNDLPISLDPAFDAE